MVMDQQERSIIPPRNRLLAALPPTEYTQLYPQLERIRLQPKQILYTPGMPLTHVYFPEGGVVSLLVVLEDGATTEVAALGNRDMVGLPLFFGASVSQEQVVCQLACEAVRIEARALLAAAASSAALHQLLHVYAAALLRQIVQTSACNRRHSTEARLTRWLLLTQDHVGADDLPVTHEALADILGVRRATVTLAAGMLQQAGLIRYQRGSVTIVDRPGLEAVACECYGVIRAAYARLGEPRA
jgi:CRP-like cAMP-binding protein